MRRTLLRSIPHTVVFIALLSPLCSVAQSDQVPPTAVIVSEDFAPLQAQWETFAGAWRIVDGTYVASATICCNLAAITSYRGLHPADPPTRTLEFDQYTLRVRIRNSGVNANSPAGVVYQFQDPGNHYAVDVSPIGNVSLRAALGGINHFIATAPSGIQPNVWFDLEVQWNKGRTTVKIDGITIFKDIEQTEFTSGQVGLQGAGTRGHFDNVFVGVPFGDQPFSESFGDGIAQGWSPLTGQWGIADGTYRNAAVQETNVTLAPIHTGPEQTASFTMQARMLNPFRASGNLVGLVFNYVKSGSRVEYNEVVFSPTGVARINRVVNRAVQTLATAPYDGRRNTWFDVKLEVDSAVSVTVDGATLFDAVNANPHQFPQRAVGLITHWAPGRFDDVSFDHGVFQPFSENFDAGLPASAVVAGSWSGAGGVLRNSSVRQTDLVALGCCLGTDTVYRARLLNEYGASGNLVGLIYSYQDANSGLNAGDYYEVVFATTDTVMLRKFIQGTTYVQATASFNIPRNTWFDVEVIRSGINTSVKVNGTSVISNVPQAQLGPGRVGVIGHWSKGRFDEISVVGARVRRPFSQLLDTNSGVDPIWCPVINNQGQVAVRVEQGGESSILRLSEDGEFTRIVSSGTQASGEQFSSIAQTILAIDNRGRVATVANLPGGEMLLIRGDAAGYEVLADPRSSDWHQMNTVDLNDAGLAVAFGSLGNGIGVFGVGAGPGLITYYSNEPPSIFVGSGNGVPLVDSNGTVVHTTAFTFTGDDGAENTETGVFTIDPNGEATLRFRSFEPVGDSFYFNLGPSVRNDHDEMAMSAAVGPTGVGAILRFTDGALSVFVQANDTIEFFANGLAINERGTIVYEAALHPNHRRALFAGPDLVDDRIIAVGDDLSGSTVTGLLFCSRGLNDNDQVALLASLADGRTGVFVADLSELLPNRSTASR